MTAFSYTNPTVGGSEDTWGETLNANWTALGNFIGPLDSTELAVLDGITATTAELNYVDGVTSAIQTQLDAKSTASATETLTNKTLTAPAINSPTINGAVSGDSLSTQAEAEAGTNNDQIMTPLRTAQAITALASGGATELISSTVISSGASEVVFTGLSNSLYSKYLFVFSYVLPTTNNRQFQANISDNNGSTWDAVYYRTDLSSGESGIRLTYDSLGSQTNVGNASSEAGYSGQLELHLSSSNSRRTYVTYSGAWFDGSTTATLRRLDHASASTTFKNYNAIKFFYSSSTLQSGTISMYGVKNS